MFSLTEKVIDRKGSFTLSDCHYDLVFIFICVPRTLQVFLNFVKNQNEINRASADGTGVSHQGAAAPNHSITSPSTANSKRASGTTNNTELIAIGGSSSAAENGEDLDDLPIQLKPTEVGLIGWFPFLTSLNF